MQPPRRILLPTVTLALLGAVPLAGCVGAPVQEMSNARQAVRAAQQAGGAKYAPDAMAEAERLLKNAKANQSKGEYRVAREEARAGARQGDGCPARGRGGQGVEAGPLIPAPTMSGWIARRCLVAGRVQGVFCRASTRAARPGTRRDGLRPQPCGRPGRSSRLR